MEINYLSLSLNTLKMQYILSQYLAFLLSKAQHFYYIEININMFLLFSAIQGSL